MKQKRGISQAHPLQRVLFFVLLLISLFVLLILGSLSLLVFGLFRDGFINLIASIGLFSITGAAAFLVWRSLSRAYRQIWGQQYDEPYEDKAKRLAKPKIMETEAEFANEIEDDYTEAKKKQER